ARRTVRRRAAARRRRPRPGQPPRAAAGRRADRQPRPAHRPRRRRAAAGTAPPGADRPRDRDAQPRAGRPVPAPPGDARRHPEADGGRGMGFGRLLLRNLAYHWRGNLAVLLGVVVGTAVLTGALLVGDSQRESLRRLALRRLGWVDQAMVVPCFFREKLADE